MPLGQYGALIYEKLYPLQVKDTGHRKGWLIEQAKELDCYKWCVENCEGYFNFTIGTISDYQVWLNHFYFEFDKEEDAILFKFYWT